MVKCHKKREELVTEATRIVLAAERIQEILKGIDKPEAISWLQSIEASKTAARMIRYYAIPYEHDKPCVLAECCRVKKPAHYFAEEEDLQKFLK